MNSTWRFLVNPFLVAAKNNYKKGIELSTYTDAALNARIADPFFNALYVIYHPLHQLALTEYNDWKSQKGIQKGTTTTLDNLLFALGFGDDTLGIKSQIYNWDLAVQNVFVKGSPDYIAIFPQGRQPFQTGDKDERINAVQALSNTLLLYPALAALQLVVVAYYNSLVAARNTQEGEISDTGSDSDELQEALAAAMVGLFSVYGACVQKYAANPVVIEPLFNLELLRDLPQTLWTGTINSSATENIFKRTLEPTRKVKLTVLTPKPLHFSVADEKNDPVQGGVTIDGFEDQIVEWQQLKQANTGTFFKVWNEDIAVPGQFKIEILPQGS